MKNAIPQRPTLDNETFGARLEYVLTESSSKVQSVLFSWFPGQSWLRVFYKCDSDSFGRKVTYDVPGNLNTVELVYGFILNQIER